MAYTIAATIREATTRAKDERKVLRVPGVMYGRGIAPQMISVGRSDLARTLRTAGLSSLIDLELAGGSAVKVLVKDIQLNPLTRELQHVDFYQVRMDEELTTTVPLRFIGESSAVKVDAGTLVKSLDELEIRCLPGNLPHEIEVDLSKLVTFDDAITVGTITLPQGVIAVTPLDVAIATVARPFTEEELLKMEASTQADLTSIKTEGEEKKAAEEAKKAEEAAAE